MFFSNKNDVTIITLINNNAILKTRMDNLELTLEKIMTDLKSLRGFVNRKVNPEQQEETKDINTGNPLAI